jgi:glycosyltransferase involved in cell wall biosynthesis
MRKISAVIACYNDEQAIPHMHQRLTETFKKIGVDYEIIFVNDGSPDRSEEVLSEIAAKDKKVIVVNHSRNFGSQNAFTSGMAISSGEGVVLLDGDLQDPPELIEQFYNKWLEGYQIVYGVRIQREAQPFMNIAYKAFYRIFNKLSYLEIPLDAGDFSLIDRCVVEVLNRLPENNRFIRGLRAWAGFKQIGVPYRRPKRMFGKTTNSLLKNFRWARKAIFSFSYAPMEFMVLLAFTVILFSIVGAILQVTLRITNPSFVPSGFTTLILLILFLGGIQLLCFGIIGSYLEHIYDEAKRRPPYIVKNILNKPR